MARLNDLLAYARRSDRRRVSTTRSGSFQTFTMLVGAGAAFGFVHQLKRIMFGPVASRLQSAEYLILALAALWLLGPLSVRPSIPTTSLQVYPIKDWQRLFYRVLSHGQNIQTLMVLIASLLGILALIRVPESALRMAQAATCFIVAASAGVALRSGFMKLTTGADHVIWVQLFGTSGLMADSRESCGAAAFSRGCPTSRYSQPLRLGQCR
jgi:hypothetical protein